MPTAISTTFGFFHIMLPSAGFFGELLNTKTVGGLPGSVNRARLFLRAIPPPKSRTNVAIRRLASNEPDGAPRASSRMRVGGGMKNAKRLALACYLSISLLASMAAAIAQPAREERGSRPNADRQGKIEQQGGRPAARQRLQGTARPALIERQADRLRSHRAERRRGGQGAQ